ncbi:phenylalanine--tRNA ligase beta subunit [Alishewanella longhuensis]
MIIGSLANEHWSIAERPVDFYDVKADVEALLALLSNNQAIRFTAAEHCALHPGQTAAVYVNDQLAGYLGALHPEAERKLGIKGKAYLFELELAALGERHIVQATRIVKIPGKPQRFSDSREIRCAICRYCC